MPFKSKAQEKWAFCAGVGGDDERKEIAAQSQKEMNDYCPHTLMELFYKAITDTRKCDFGTQLLKRNSVWRKQKGIHRLRMV